MDHTDEVARTKQCRVVPPLASAGMDLAGQTGLKIFFHPCAGSMCMHWEETGQVSIHPGTDKTGHNVSKGHCGWKK